jgi:hypothetical protein
MTHNQVIQRDSALGQAISEIEEFLEAKHAEQIELINH